MLLLRLLDPALSPKSSITVDGLSLETMNRQSLRTHIIAIPQDSILIGQLTWKENLQSNDDSTVEECEGVLEEVKLLDIIRHSGGVDAHAKPDALSHGQKQLFNLARAVLKCRQREKRANTKYKSAVEKLEKKRCGGLLLLDEMSSSVDEGTEAMMHSIIMKEFSAYTIIAVAHRLNSVKDFDSVVVLEDGSIKEKCLAKEYFERLGI